MREGGEGNSMYYKMGQALGVQREEEPTHCPGAHVHSGRKKSHFSAVWQYSKGLANSRGLPAEAALPKTQLWENEAKAAPHQRSHSEGQPDSCHPDSEEVTGEGKT